MQSLKCQALEMELANAESPNALPFLLGMLTSDCLGKVKTWLAQTQTYFDTMRLKVPDSHIAEPNLL